MTKAGRVAFAMAIAIVMVGVEFFVILHSDLSLPLFVRIALAYMNMIPVALALRLSGGTSSGPNLVVVGIAGFFQWFLIGFLISLLFGRRRRQA